MILKRLAVCAVAIALPFSFLCGCGNNQNAEIIGNWTPTTASLNGETVQYSYLGLEDDYFGFTFKNGGKCTATLAGVSGDGTYTFNGTSVDVEINNEVKKLNYESGTLTLTLNYDNDTTTFTFTKADSSK